jgi:SAM-dependent methyltransferase
MNINYDGKILSGNIDYLFENNNIFGDFFNEWRILRTLKLEKNLGSDWFKNKKILEVGCAFGNIGLYFESLGSKVTFSDANESCLNNVLLKNKNANVILLNNENYWDFDEKFDLIINFGLLYNLKNWKNDLLCSIKNSKILALETAVTKYDTESEFKIINYKYSHILHGPYSKEGSLVSSVNIENVFRENNSNFKRYDDRDLNLPNYSSITYDWKEINCQNIKEETLNSWWCNDHCGGRRFWITHNV